MSDEDTTNDSGKLLFCSFCGKNQNEVRRLIAGPSVYICDECVDLCNDIITEEAQTTDERESSGSPSAHRDQKHSRRVCYWSRAR